MKEENKLGHNKPPKTVEEMINDQGRINLSNSVIRKLKRKVDDNGIISKLCLKNMKELD